MKALRIRTVVACLRLPMTFFAKYLLIALALAAVGTSQVSGIARGFLCACGATPVMTSGASCEADGCHDGDHHSEDDHGDHHDHEDHGDRHQHREVKDSLVGTSFVPLTLSLPAAVECDLTPILAQGVRLASEMAEQRAELKPPDDTGGSAAASVLVARSVVMLV